MVHQHSVKPPITLVQEIAAEITRALNLDPTSPPVTIDPKQVSTVLGVQTSTLAIWRSTGRYRLPYIKTSRHPRYRILDVATFIASRRLQHTGSGGIK